MIRSGIGQRLTIVSGGRAYLTASWTDSDTLESWGNAAVATFDASVEEPLLVAAFAMACSRSTQAPDAPPVGRPSRGAYCDG